MGRPIAVVRGELGLARSGAGDDEPRASLDSVLDEVERLERLAHNLLVLARSRSGSLTAGNTPVDLETVVDRAARAIARRADNRHVHVRCLGNGVVNGDESSLQRAMPNLPDNAGSHAASEVTVTVIEDRTFLDATAAHDRPGFPEDLLPHPFSPFHPQ